MLRLGMRMTKVDLQNAETWVNKAIAGGVITDYADIAKMSYLSAGQEINVNPVAFGLFRSDYISGDGFTNSEGGKYHETFIDSLKANNDPRLRVISIVYDANKVANDDPAIQLGMPADLPNQKPTVENSGTDFRSYSEPKPSTVLRQGAPLLIFTIAETNYLLAEAALRGWYGAETPEALFEKGIRASMQQWDLISGTTDVIDPDDVNDYVAAHPLTTGATFEEQLELVYNQFWVGAFPDAQEVYNAYRRTGYPNLVPNNYSGNATQGRIFRRFLYPVTEQTLNGISYQAALDAQGPDDLMTRIWWDPAN
jgi:hypothetical protein